MSSTAKTSDVYLKVTSKRSGFIKGESKTEGHVDEILVSSWAWAMSSVSTPEADSQPSRRRSYSALRIEKSIDCSSTSLMACMAQNDDLKEVVLCVRKAGGDALDYYTITLKGGRVRAIEQEVRDSGQPIEAVSFGFTKLEVVYKAQEKKGGGSGSYVFTDELLGDQ